MAFIQRASSSAILRRFSRPARRDARRGSTLAEVLIAILLTAIIVVTVFGVSLTVRRNVGHYDTKVMASAAQIKLIEVLKNYVTAAQEPGWGPNNGNWNLAGDTYPGYALQPAVIHDVTSLLPASYQASPYNMTLTYTVTNINPAGQGFRAQINVAVHWTEPPT